MRRWYALLGFVAALSLVVMLFSSAEGKRPCQCFFIGDCYFDGNSGYRYYHCRGTCNEYSEWRLNTNCVPDYPRRLVE